MVDCIVKMAPDRIEYVHAFINAPEEFGIDFCVAKTNSFFAYNGLIFVVFYVLF